MHAMTELIAADDALLKAMAQEAGKFVRAKNHIRERTRAICLAELEKGSRFSSEIVDPEGIASVAAIGTCLRKMLAMKVPLVDRELCPKNGADREYWHYSITEAGRMALKELKE